MPRMGSEIYAAHMDNALKLAKKADGVTKPQLMKELNVTRAVASGLIEKCGLVRDGKRGKAEVFKAPETKQKLAEPEEPKVEEVEETPPEVEESAEPVDDSTGEDEVPFDEALQKIDDELFDCLKTLKVASESAGKALASWSSQLALVDASRKRMTELTVERNRLLARE